MTSSESYIILAVVAALALVALIYLLSPMSLLEDITTRGAEIRTRLRELLPRHATGDAKTDWLIASTDIALEHQEAVERLVKSELYGSAFGVVQMFDAMIRALWINACATTKQIEQACREELHWPTSKMREAIKQAYFSGPCSSEEAARRETLFEFLDKSWPIMCDYTHSGSRQIARRFTKSGNLKPDYSDGAIVQAVNLTNFAVLLMTSMLFHSMGDESKADKSASMRRDYAKEFGERLQAINQARMKL
jgi:uncharacterized protein DUF6988